MELLVLVGILFALFIAEIIYYRIHALENLHLKVEFSKDVAQFGEDIELVEIAENKKRLPLPFIILKFEAPREIKFYDMENTSTSDLLYRTDIAGDRARLVNLVPVIADGGISHNAYTQDHNRNQKDGSQRRVFLFSGSFFRTHISPLKFLFPCILWLRCEARTRTPELQRQS